MIYILCSAEFKQDFTVLQGWADASFVPQSYSTAIWNSRYPKRTCFQQEKKSSVPWEQAGQRLTCRLFTFSTWQHVWDRLSKELYFSGALHCSFHSTELLICFFWQQSLPMCELQGPRQMNSYHNCQTARAICLLGGNCYLPDRHGWLSPSALLRASSTLCASLLHWQRRVWRSLYLQY